MRRFTKIWTRICRRWTKIRLQPIRVYCLHHVSATFDATSMNRADWMQLTAFKCKVIDLQQDGVEFITLNEAYRHICKDVVRRKKFAVLTFDDGYASLREVLPWLEEQHIPATLFINGKYLDGRTYRENPKEQYLTKDELFALTSPIIEIGSHGWEHIQVSDMNNIEFNQSVELNEDILKAHPRHIPFYAYTYGIHTRYSTVSLHEHKLLPVYIDGMVNYNENQLIHREPLK